MAGSREVVGVERRGGGVGWRRAERRRREGSMEGAEVASY